MTTFGYWGIRGAGQPLKFLLEYLEIKFEDKKYTSPEAWGADKAAFLQTDPLANLPYLQHEGKTIFESGAIAVYLAHQAKRPELFGTNTEEQVAVAQTRGVIEDLRRNGFKAFWGNKEEFEANGKQLVRDASVPFLKKLEYILTGKKFVAGNNVTIADFLLFEQVDLLRTFDESIVEPFPNLRQFHQNFREIPQIKAYIASERYQARPYFPPHFANWG